MRVAHGLLIPIFLAAGCGEGESERKYRTIEGTAEEINPPHRVSMSFVNDKGIQRTVDGTVDPNAEIWINGRQAVLEDIKPGDAVRVIGYAEGSGTNKSFVATKIEVETTTFDVPDAPAAGDNAPSAKDQDGSGGDR